MKIKFSDHLSRMWWAYLLIAAVCAAIWISMFRAAVQPPAEARLDIAFVGVGLDREALEQELPALLRENGAPELEEVRAATLNYGENALQSNAFWARSMDADLMIVTQSQMFDGIGTNYFVPLEEYKLHGALYQENGTAYGLILENGAQGLSRWYAGEEGCYVFLTDRGREKPAALAALRWLTE